MNCRRCTYLGAYGKNTLYTNYGGKVGIKISLYHICHRKIRGKGEKLPFIRSISRDNINYYRTRTSLG